MTFPRFGWLLLAVVRLAGCATPIGIRQVSPRDSYREAMANPLTEGVASYATNIVLRRFDLAREYERNQAGVIATLNDKALHDDRRDILYALAELSYLYGERLEKSTEPAERELAPDYFLLTSIYAYLFLLDDRIEPPPTAFDTRAQKTGVLEFQHVLGAGAFPRVALFDRERLPGEARLDTPAGRIYFTGDTGYSPDFKEIGERLGPMRLALIHLGGYRPRWFMKPMHADPQEAVKIHRDVRARQSIRMHWGTFRLTDEPLGEPPRYLQRALKQAKIPADRFVVLKIGETRVYGSE